MSTIGAVTTICLMEKFKVICTISTETISVKMTLLWVASIGITFEIFPRSHSEPKVMKAVTTLGRQLGGETFVFGPTVQLCSNGDLIPLESQEYEWVQQVVDLASVIPDSPLLELVPHCDRPLETLLQGLQTLTQENFGSAVFVLGA